jgi:hypothetical protein
MGSVWVSDNNDQRKACDLAEDLGRAIKVPNGEDPASYMYEDRMIPV